jgi:protein TonB
MYGSTPDIEQTTGSFDRLDWRGLAAVLAGHLALLGALLSARPRVDSEPLQIPIFATLVQPERAEPTPEVPSPPLPAPEPEPSMPTRAATPPPQEPEPQQVLAVPESAPTSVAVVPPPDPAPESTAPVSELATPAQPVAPASATAESLAGNKDDIRKYITAMMRQLNKHKTYPRELKKARTEGTVVLQFTIDRAGRLLASGVKQSSGHPELDRAALDMLARAEPLPGIPDFMDRDELSLAIPVEYSLITDR